MQLVCPECKRHITYVHEVVFRCYITAKITYDDEKNRFIEELQGIHDCHAQKIVYRCPICGREACSINDYVNELE